MRAFYIVPVVAALLLLPPLPCRAQTAGELETLLAAGRVDYGQAARFALEAADAAVFGESGEAFACAQERGWLPRNVLAAETARYGGVSLLLMRAFGMKGGLFYSIFKNPHYAYRELIYLEIIPPRADPGMPVSGGDLVYMTGRLLDMRERAEAGDR